MKAEMLLDFMEEVESEKEYDGYYYSLGEALTIVVLGSLCGLKMSARFTSGQKATERANG